MTRARVRIVRLIAALMLLLGTTAACGLAGSSWSCDEQKRMAQELSRDPSLAAIKVDHFKVGDYQSYPCKGGNSGSNYIYAGKLYTTGTTLTMGEAAVNQPPSARSTGMG